MSDAETKLEILKAIEKINRQVINLRRWDCGTNYNDDWLHDMVKYGEVLQVIQSVKDEVIKDD